VVKKGVEVEIPAIRFMLEFRTPSERERINIMETPTRQKISLLGKDRAEVERLTEMHGLVVRQVRRGGQQRGLYEPHGGTNTFM
jgi:hypothetical protein